MSWFCSLFNSCKRHDESNNNNNNNNNINENENGKENKIKKIKLDFYDSILKIDRIIDIIQKGWEIKLNNNSNCDYNFVKIGIIGETKKGKTYIIQKLINQNIDKNEIIKTEGLSIKYPNDEDIKNNRNYIILDSEGIEKPLLNKKVNILDYNQIELNEIDNMTKEKLLIELFIQQFIIKYSEIPILVLDELTFSEQKILIKIQNILKCIKGYKKMFIIHNLQNYYYIQEVKEYITKILLNLIGINLKEREGLNTMINKENNQKNNIYYEQEFAENKNYSIIHLIMANEFSEAGNFYNSFTIDFIKTHLNQFTNLPFFSLKKNIIEHFIEFSNSILKEPAVNDQFQLIESHNKIIIKYNGQINYKNHLDYKLDTFNLYNNNIIPEYSYYILNEKFIVELEVAGKTSDIKCYYHLENGYHYFNFSGKKIDDKKDNLEIHNFYTSIKNNIFKLNFHIEADNILLASNDYEFKDLGNGILSFAFELYKKRNNKKSYE